MSTLNSTAADEQWLAVLAGRESPDASDISHRKAAQVRRFFEQRDEHENAQLPSAASQARLLAKLQRPDVQAAIAAAHWGKPQAKERSLADIVFSAPLVLLDWLLPPGGNNTGRYAMVAGVVMAVLVVPMLVQQRGTPDDEPAIKSVPKGLPAAAAQLVLAENPAQTAAQIQQALAAAGIAVSVQASASDSLVSASVPPASQAAARQQLAPWGLAVPANGQLQIRIARSQ